MASNKASEAPEDGADQRSGSFMQSLSSWGGSAWNYAASTFSSIMGYEELDVVNPEAGEATHMESDLNDQRQKEFGAWKDYVGMDIISLVALPVWISEPFTNLQKMGEVMEYTQLLDKAALVEDEYERMAWVVAFCMSPYGCAERTWKPFNPILGETFEFEREGVRYMAEQVSHHPPIGAGHGEGENWVYDLVSAPSTKFLGNSVEIYPIGRTRIKLKTTGELFTHSPANARAHNVIMGRTWVDHYGNFTVSNATTGAKCVLYFTPCGWFSSGRYSFSGYITSKDGEKKYQVAGKWNQYLDAVKCDAEGEPLQGAQTVRMWTCEEKPKGDKYGFTKFTHLLNKGVGINPLPSDARRRPDRWYLEIGETSTAGQQKHLLEEMQRAERKEREKRGEKWKPRFFKQIDEPELNPGEVTVTECPFWEWNGEAWKLPKRAALEDVDIGGKDFCPWQYPEMHKQS